MANLARGSQPSHNRFMTTLLLKSRNVGGKFQMRPIPSSAPPPTSSSSTKLSIWQAVARGPIRPDASVVRNPQGAVEVAGYIQGSRHARGAEEYRSPLARRSMLDRVRLLGMGHDTRYKMQEQCQTGCLANAGMGLGTCNSHRARGCLLD